MAKKQKIRFENPPVNEVAIGVGFAPLMLFKAQHVGLFWSAIRDEFPECQNVSPIGVPFGAPDEVFPLTRFWFISHDETNLIQFQRNRFYLNWRKRPNGEKYSSFDERWKSFSRRLGQLEKFLLDNNLGRLQFNYAELNYINHFTSENGWKSLSDTKNIISSFEFIGSPKISAQTDALLYQGILNTNAHNGPLTVKIQNGSNAETHENVLIYELKRHVEQQIELKSEIESWFVQANEDLDLYFEATTAPSAQKIWGKVSPSERVRKK